MRKEADALLAGSENLRERVNNERSTSKRRICSFRETCLPGSKSRGGCQFRSDCLKCVVKWHLSKSQMEEINAIKRMQDRRK